MSKEIRIIKKIFKKFCLVLFIVSIGTVAAQEYQEQMKDACLLRPDTLTVESMRAMIGSLNGIRKKFLGIGPKSGTEKIEMSKDLLERYSKFLNYQYGIYKDRLYRDNLHAPLLRIELLNQVTKKVVGILKDARPHVNFQDYSDDSYEKKVVQWMKDYLQWAQDHLAQDWRDPFLRENQGLIIDHEARQNGVERGAMLLEESIELLQALVQGLFGLDGFK